MNIYSRKQLWKWGLLIIAILIFSASLLYTNRLVNKIEKEERNKARLWAEAIQKKADLVKYTNELFDELKVEERKKGALWANGIRQLMNVNSNQDLTFIFEVVKNNETIPVILTNAEGNIINHRNVDTAITNYPLLLRQELEHMGECYPPLEIRVSNTTKNFLYYKDSRLFTELRDVMDDLIQSFISEVVTNSASVPVIYTDSSQTYVLAHNHRGENGEIVDANNEGLLTSLAEMKTDHVPIKVELKDGHYNYIFYKESFLLTQLRYYPYVQFAVVGVFLMVAYFLFSVSRRAEQNQVWVGMSKETAHQLGTPISSMMAWMELLKSKYGDDEVIDEILKDVSRLETIAERFSKVGSVPELNNHDIHQVLVESVSYMKTRLSKLVEFKVLEPDQPVGAVKISIPLFEWVIENITKNAVDAMEGRGRINFEIQQKADKVYIDITDTGKGVPKSKFKTIFQPGFTTKKRGWGLGLSLVKRIIENYHQGKVFVRNSEPDKGTTFRIILNCE